MQQLQPWQASEATGLVFGAGATNSDDMTEFSIRRLSPQDASAISACFQRVYGDSYGNRLFYDSNRLADALADGTLASVGATDEHGQVLGHMAMTHRPGAGCAELGNTVVDPEARGGGVAWQVGAELIAWCREAGYWGFLHYPTTDHHIMQRQSVKQGFETGVMLGYIPAQTDGGVNKRGTGLRQAATIVFEPLGKAPAATAFLPSACSELVPRLNAAIAMPRSWVAAAEATTAQTQFATTTDNHRGLARLSIERTGQDAASCITAFLDAHGHQPCLQLDLLMSDAGLATADAAARARGFQFCGWLPGFAQADVLRLQMVNPSTSELTPDLVNPTARALLSEMT